MVYSANHYVTSRREARKRKRFGRLRNGFRAFSLWLAFWLSLSATRPLFPREPCLAGLAAQSYGGFHSYTAMLCRNDWAAYHLKYARHRTISLSKPPAILADGFGMRNASCRSGASQDNTLCMAWRSDPIDAFIARRCAIVQ